MVLRRGPTEKSSFMRVGFERERGLSREVRMREVIFLIMVS